MSAEVHEFVGHRDETATHGKEVPDICMRNLFLKQIGLVQEKYLCGRSVAGTPIHRAWTHEYSSRQCRISACTLPELQSILHLVLIGISQPRGGRVQ